MRMPAYHGLFRSPDIPLKPKERGFPFEGNICLYSSKPIIHKNTNHYLFCISAILRFFSFLQPHLHVFSQTITFARHFPSIKDHHLANNTSNSPNNTFSFFRYRCILMIQMPRSPAAAFRKRRKTSGRGRGTPRSRCFAGSTPNLRRTLMKQQFLAVTTCRKLLFVADRIRTTSAGVF